MLEGRPDGGTQWLPTFAIQMSHPFLGAWWPEGRICHDSGAGVISANGRTTMDEGTTLEDEHVPWRACKSALIAICLQVFLESFTEMIMATGASFRRLELKRVAARPNVEGSL